MDCYYCKFNSDEDANECGIPLEQQQDWWKEEYICPAFQPDDEEEIEQ